MHTFLTKIVLTTWKLAQGLPNIAIVNVCNQDYKYKWIHISYMLKPYYSIGSCEWKFIQSFEKCSILAPDIWKQHQTSFESLFKGILKVRNEWSLEGAMYINLW